MPARWGRAWLLAWVAISCIWVAAIAFLAVETNPRVPLDMSRGDPQVVAAYDRAVTRHMLRYLFAGVLPPALLFLLLWAIVRLRRPASTQQNGSGPDGRL